MLSAIFKDIGITLDNVSPLGNIQTIFKTMKDAMMQRVAVTKDEIDALRIAIAQ